MLHVNEEEKITIILEFQVWSYRLKQSYQICFKWDPLTFPEPFLK